MNVGEVKFFSNRREMEIGDFHSLKTRGGERRVKVAMRIPLSNRPTTGIPSWILDGYQFIVKDASPYSVTKCKDIKLEGMSIEFFTTDTVKRRMQQLASCTMDKFALERVGEDDKAIVYLTFTLYAPCGKEIIGWFYDYQGATAFSEFDTTQASFAYDGEEEEEDGEEVPADSVVDPNDDPTAPIPGDKRKVTLPTDKPGSQKRSHHAKKGPTVN